jgi:acetylornithine deacetylase/succinyl-diaminopimelate desuccinylase-like protein
VAGFVDRERLLDTARRLIDAPSPTGRAGPALDALAALLEAEGFVVERPEAGHPEAPAVVARLVGGEAGRTIQFNGHLDTVHLPFAPFGIDGGNITGSGAADMKGGTAAAVEALLALRDSGMLTRGTVLLTAHDLHEAPWAFGAQLDRIIAEGLHGDAVLIPEPLCKHLPIRGRGQACWKITLRREEPAVHEVMRPANLPDLLTAGATLALILNRLDDELAEEVDEVAGRSSVFIGMLNCGEIYNQSARECHLEGTRRWIPGKDRREVEHRFKSTLKAFAKGKLYALDLTYQLVRDAFALDPACDVVSAFQTAYRGLSGHDLPVGPKPFVDDGNSFSAAGVPAITHGPNAGGQHTTSEWAEIDDLARVARLYATTALGYLAAGAE